MLKCLSVLPHFLLLKTWLSNTPAVVNSFVMIDVLPTSKYHKHLKQSLNTSPPIGRYWTILVATNTTFSDYWGRCSSRSPKISPKCGTHLSVTFFYTFPLSFSLPSVHLSHRSPSRRPQPQPPLPGQARGGTSAAGSSTTRNLNLQHG